MHSLEPLVAEHAEALLRFEQENRAYFARTVPDGGDDYFAGFAARHAALLAEQATGRCRFHVLVDAEGDVVGRFNLVDLADGCAELGFRVAERAAGRGLATLGIRLTCARAREEYGLRRLVAQAAQHNAGSLAVLRRTGFTVTGEVRHEGGVDLLHEFVLTPAG